jgi:hypothetical protein
MRGDKNKHLKMNRNFNLPLQEIYPIIPTILHEEIEILFFRFSYIYLVAFMYANFSTCTRIHKSLLLHGRLIGVNRDTDHTNTHGLKITYCKLISYISWI